MNVVFFLAKVTQSHLLTGRRPKHFTVYLLVHVYVEWNTAHGWYTYMVFTFNVFLPSCRQFESEQREAFSELQKKAHRDRTLLFT